MKIWPHTSATVIEPPEPKVIFGRPWNIEEKRISPEKYMKSYPRRE